MKFLTALSTGLSLALVLPAIAPGSQDGVQKRGLEQLLGDVSRSLDSLRRLESELAGAPLAPAKPPPALLEQLRQQTDAPLVDERAASELLERLRAEVGQLQSTLEGGRAQGSGEIVRSSADVGPRATGDVAGSALRHGSTLSSPSAAPQASPSTAFQVAPTASADPLRQAQVCLRAGKPDQALRLLESAPRSAAVLYWKGRALEQLGRDAEALETYRAVLLEPRPGNDAERARSAIGFLEWKLGLERAAKASGPDAASGSPEAAPSTAGAGGAR